MVKKFEHTVKQHQIIWAIVFFLFIVVLFVSLFHILTFIKENEHSRKITNELIDNAVEIPESPTTDQDTISQENADTQEVAPIIVDFTTLNKYNSDIIAWVYCPNTQINYPVAQSRDNSFYLRRLLDGSYNTAGTLFAD